MAHETIERILPSGALYISNLIGGHRRACTYYGHSVKDALRSFRQDCRDSRQVKWCSSCRECYNK